MLSFPYPVSPGLREYIKAYAEIDHGDLILPSEPLHIAEITRWRNSDRTADIGGINHIMPIGYVYENHHLFGYDDISDTSNFSKIEFVDGEPIRKLEK